MSDGSHSIGLDLINAVHQKTVEIFTEKKNLIPFAVVFPGVIIPV